jgi:hypothetical protein
MPAYEEDDIEYKPGNNDSESGEEQTSDDEKKKKNKKEKKYTKGGKKRHRGLKDKDDEDEAEDSVISRCVRQSLRATPVPLTVVNSTCLVKMGERTQRNKGGKKRHRGLKDKDDEDEAEDSVIFRCVRESLRATPGPLTVVNSTCLVKMGDRTQRNRPKSTRVNRRHQEESESEEDSVISLCVPPPVLLLFSICCVKMGERSPTKHSTPKARNRKSQDDSMMVP